MLPSTETPGLRPLTQREFEQFRRLARDTFGLDLRAGKEPLVAARLGKIAGKLRLRSYQEYYEYVLSDRTGQALRAMVEALATNHTGFLREPSHFEFLAQAVISEWQDRSRIRIWSAACSSGEEPYSAAFCLLDCVPPHMAGRIEIFATDISNRVLDIARKGVYAAERFAQVPRHWLSKYLLRGQGRFQGFYRVKPEVQKLITFQRLNLIDPFPSMQPFSVIFCRNVMIYFDRSVQETLVGRAAALLEAGGYLFIGHSESLSSIEQPLEYVRPAIYRKLPAVRQTIGFCGLPVRFGKADDQKTIHPASREEEAMNRLIVGMADCKVSDDPSAVLITYALGSCIGLAIHDPVSHVGGLLHFVLPDSSLDAARAGQNPYRYADTAIPALLGEVCKRGAQRHRLRIAVAGAAEIMDEGALFNIGKRNRAALHRIFWKEGVLISAEAVGGTVPRTLSLEIGSGRFFLRTAGEPEREMLPSRFTRKDRSDYALASPNRR